MRRSLPIFFILLASGSSVQARGLLIPEDKSVPPLAMVNHQVTIAIDDQVATTRLEQTFRNHTQRQLEATYIFPVPKGASVNKFTMWVNGKEMAGELLDAPKARQIYTDIVRRTEDPGLLEYLGNNLFRLRVFPILPNSDQKVSLSFQAVAPQDSGLIEYIYPLKTDGKATRTLEDFSVKGTIKSQHAIQNVYSPTHAITISRTNDKEVNFSFLKEQALLDKDFQVFYSTGDKDVGLTTLMHRPVSAEDGYFMVLMSPKAEMSLGNYIPRDIVLVLDTSGSMDDEKMRQAKKALTYVLSNLKEKDRFALINFSTTVNRYRENLVAASSEQVDDAKKWVERLRQTGGTAINDALMAGLEMRSSDPGRSFFMIFFTDGQPTIGETNIDKIVKNVAAKNTANTRIFTFGVGDSGGVNATFLDTLAEQTRAVSTFVRPSEDIEAKVTSLYNKISHPVLANLKLSLGDQVSISEVYPPNLPDLFHGGQVVVLGRYHGSGPVAIKLTGQVGMDQREFVYETTFAPKTGDDKGFVEDIWARRKVGFLLDQIRLNGEKKELVDEVTALAKKYGIATPYTSYLVVPDAPMPVAGPGGAMRGTPTATSPAAPPVLAQGGANAPKPLAEFARELGKDGKKVQDEVADKRARVEEKRAEDASAGRNGEKGEQKHAAQETLDRLNAYRQAREALARRDQNAVQSNWLGVNLSIQNQNLKNQSQITQNAQRKAGNRNCIDVGGVWIDDSFDAKMPIVAVKAMSAAYFRILELKPEMKEVFKLGNHLVWVTPNGSALVIDQSSGSDKLSDEEIEKLFVAKK